MILFMMSCVALTASVAAVRASRPATVATRRRADARRARFVEANPTHANSTDIVAGLVRGGLAPRQARLVADHARATGVQPFTMWLWLERFGADSLGVAVVADLTQAQLLAHLGAGTSPDLRDLRLFASLNGLDLDGVSAVTRGSSGLAA
ncbi:hypothetical protein [Nocardioides sp.]|uniref:hypothetical protein n=1 Tax=Nocardioides sp. TaxID=35761 RepID=UPI002B27A4CF|nr:hypothetical protein [Nocardioides sp.]